jgi:hypothetical protein
MRWFIARSAPDYLHCPFFLRSSIVIAQFELQTRPAPPWGFRFWHMLIQAFKSQLTAASAGGANMTGPQTSAANMNASDNRRVMDDLPQIILFEKRSRFSRRALAYQKPDLL